MKIAILGAGVAGLSAAYGLRLHHDVTLFEAQGYLGGHVNTVDVELPGTRYAAPERHAVDTGFIVYNERTYPRFIQLLSELGVASQPTSMSFSVCCQRSGLQYSGSSLRGLYCQPLNLLRPGFQRMLAEILWFNRQARRQLATLDPADDQRTIADFLRSGGYSRRFAQQYLLPLGSAIWSCPPETFAGFPLRFILEFYENHGLLQLLNRPRWRVIQGGSRQYVAALARQLTARVRLNTPIQSVRRYEDRVEVTPRGASPETFDHVVFACHADQALRMLADPAPVERELLSAFPFERNVATLHTDTRLLPRSRRAWAAWNYFVPAGGQTQATVTYCMNILQHLQSRHTLCVTLNGEQYIDPAKILRQFVYEHPTYDTRRSAAQARHVELMGPRRSSFCGAYWRNGFHEDGVVSALAVCRVLNGRGSASAASDTTWQSPVADVSSLAPMERCDAQLPL